MSDGGRIDRLTKRVRVLEDKARADSGRPGRMAQLVKQAEELNDANAAVPDQVADLVGSMATVRQEMETTRILAVAAIWVGGTALFAAVCIVVWLTGVGYD